MPGGLNAMSKEDIDYLFKKIEKRIIIGVIIVIMFYILLYLFFGAVNSPHGSIYNSP